jgi:hypothetical protein
MSAPAERMRLSELSERWALEIGWEADRLAGAIVIAAADGEFDNLPEPERLVTRDHETGKIEPFGKGHISKNSYETDERRYLPRGTTLQRWIEIAMFQVHRNAVAAFADPRELAGPSWWTAPAGVDYKVNVAAAALSRFLLDTADGQKTEKEVRAMATSYFAGKKITDPLWRAAWGKMPPEKRRRRGRTPRSNTAA